jgi:hypothetical protein
MGVTFYWILLLYTGPLSYPHRCILALYFRLGWNENGFFHFNDFANGENISVGFAKIKAEIFQLLLFLEIFRENHKSLSISARNSVKWYIIFANIDRTTDVFAAIFAKYTSTNLYRKNVSFRKNLQKNLRPGI